MAQNLTTYPKNDPSIKLTVTADKVAYANLLQTDGATWLSKDLGVDAIDSGVSLAFLCKNTGSGTQPFVANNMWSNTDTDWLSHHDVGGRKHAMSYFDTFELFLRYWDGASVHDDFTSGLSADVERLIDFSRSGQVYTMIIYNGATVGSGVLDTLTVNAGETPPDFQYHIACSNFTGGQPGTVTGFGRTYEFTGLPVVGGGGLRHPIYMNDVVW